MARTRTDTSIPPPLRSLGGWEDAEWFCPSLLSEDEVVGISLPRLPGSRKLNFHLVERSAPAAPPAGRRARAAQPLPERVAAGIGDVLDDVGVTRAAAFRKPTFFFEAAPALYFADIPAANLKVRAAERLRRELIRIAFRGCVVRQEPGRVMAMFWPSTDREITCFVDAARPTHPLHAQFDLAGTAGQASPPAAGASRRDQAERERLLGELDGLRARIADLQRSQSALGAMETLGLDDARLRSMLLLLHPDRHGNSDAANEAAKWVNALRDVLKAGRARPG